MSLRLLRALKILRVALRYGLDEIVLSAAAVPPRWRVVSGLFFWRELRAPRGERLRRALEELGPIFVKFGQVLSTRRDLLPADIADELAHLQDRVPPFSSALAIAQITRSLGQHPDTLFAHFERARRRRSRRCILRHSKTAPTWQSKFCVPVCIERLGKMSR